MKFILPFLLAIICLTSIQAQTKIEAARSYLGSKYTETMPAGKAVWQFEKDAIYTNPDGTWTFEKDLTNRYSFQNTVSYGKLKAVTINGVAVQPGQRIQPAEPVTSRMESQPVTMTDKPLSIGDSITYAEKVQQGVKAAEYLIDQAKEKGKDTWAGVWQVFNMLKLVIGTVAIIFWFWASFGAGESFINEWGHTIVGKKIVSVQQNSAASLFFILGCIGTLYLIQWAFQLSDWDFPVEAKLALLAVAAWVVSWAVQKYTPNLRVRSTKNKALPGGGGWDQIT